MGDADTVGDSGIWASDGSTLHLVLRHGEPAPGFGAGCVPLANMGASDPSVLIDFPRFPDIDSSGRVVVISSLTGCSVGRASDVVWTWKDGSLDRLFVPSEPSLLFDAVTSESGVMAFSGSSSNDVLWTAVGETVGVLVTTGALFEHGAGSGSLSAIHPFGLSVNDAGRVVFVGETMAPGGARSGLLAAGGGDNRVIAQEGGAAPGTGGAVFADMAPGTLPVTLPDFKITETGRVVFAAWLEPGVGMPTRPTTSVSGPSRRTRGCR